MPRRRFILTRAHQVIRAESQGDRADSAEIHNCQQPDGEIVSKGVILPQ